MTSTSQPKKRFSFAQVLLMGFFCLLLLFVTFISVPIYVNSNCSLLMIEPTVTKWGLPWKKIPCKFTGIMWGKSALEYGEDLKCLVDKEGYCFLFNSCTPVSCPSTEKTPNSNGDAIEELINSGCISYNDGCNDCSVMGDGVAACTKKMCPTNYRGEPSCFKYKDKY